MKEKVSKKRKIMIAALIVLTVVCLTSGGIAVFETVRSVKEEEAFGDLKSKLGDVDYAVPEAEPEELTENEEAAEAAPEESAEEKPKPVRISTNGRYDELYEQNPDMFGWIKIEDTKIDYPVMFTPSDPDYYLHHSFEKRYTASGTPFVDSTCFEGCGNYLIYGHHMNNKKMFAGLLDYADEEFWESHKTVIFDTVEEHGEYTIFAAFNTKVFKASDDDAFHWYNYTDLTDEDVFNEYIEKINEVKLYDTGVDVGFGDELITLSTCGSTSRKRFVVVAKRVV